MKLGLAVPHYDVSFPDRQPATFDRIARYAELAESLGFFQLWVSDHFWLDLERYGGPAGRQGTPECWTTLSALAVRTSRVRLGSLVLAAGFRPPTLLAKMAATLDQLSGGRLDLGLGAGWNQAEFVENGLAFPRPGERLAMLEEALAVLAALLEAGGEPASFQGRYFTADRAPVLPGPVQRPRPPLWVGGSGDRLLGVVARAADGWNLCWSVTPEAYRERLAVLAVACERAGRPVGRDPGRGRAARLGRLPARRHPRRDPGPAPGLGGAGGGAGGGQLLGPAVRGVRGRAAGAGGGADPAAPLGDSRVRREDRTGPPRGRIPYRPPNPSPVPPHGSYRVP
jgi:alkanesulfonate monooxygenase SsuD/methylene tetrahydromethanopterin reductase-like flavin-dependent oxidoreductase (luciferase family)